jgi:hypothetical protein
MNQALLPFAKRARVERDGELTNEELVEYREKYAIAQALVKFGCALWPDTFELAIKIGQREQTRSNGYFSWTQPGSPKYKPIVMTWGWISHSLFVCKLFSLEGDTGSTYKGGECQFTGWHYPEGRNVIPMPCYEVQMEDSQAVHDFHKCLQWIAAYHTTLHDAQVDMDMVTAVVPSLSRKVQEIGDSMPMEINGNLKMLKAMDQFGL